MKHFLLAILVFASSSAFAANEFIPIPDGNYSGTGTWSDNNGNEGSWQMTDAVSLNGHHHVFNAHFSDDRTYSGAVDVEFSDRSHYKFIAPGPGRPVIGRGISSSDSYENIGMHLSPFETANEWGSLVNGVVWNRNGTITDRRSGRVTFMRINLMPQP